MLPPPPPPFLGGWQVCMGWIRGEGALPTHQQHDDDEADGGDHRQDTNHHLQ